MKHVKTSKGSFIFVEVPDHAIPDLMFIDAEGTFIVDHVTLVWSGNPPEPDHEEWTCLLELDLSGGDKYEFINTVKNITEEQAAMVVDSEYLTFNGVCHGICYCHYYYKDDVCEWYSGKFNPAVNSLKSLIKYELELGTDKNYAIIKVL